MSKRMSLLNTHFHVKNLKNAYLTSAISCTMCVQREHLNAVTTVSIKLSSKTQSKKSEANGPANIYLFKTSDRNIRKMT